MSLIEAEETGPIEGDDAVVTPPRPPHRRVSISLLFTLTTLTATVVLIYVSFPARNSVLMTEAIDRHHDGSPAWDLTRPSAAELHAWAIAVVGKDPPIPANATIVGARETEVLGRRAAVVGLEVAGEPITYLVQYTRVISPGHSTSDDGDLRAIAWRTGPFTCVAVGSAASASRWTVAVGAN